MRLVIKGQNAIYEFISDGICNATGMRTKYGKKIEYYRETINMLRDELVRLDEELRKLNKELNDTAPYILR